MKRMTQVFTAVVLLGAVQGTWAGNWHGHGHGHGHHHHWHGSHHGYGFHFGHGFHHRHGGTHFGFVIGAPLFWDIYPYPYTYPSRYRYVYPRHETRVYVQPPQNYWYYCPSSGGYYPYVQNCPTDWMKVVPQSPSN